MRGANAPRIALSDATAALTAYLRRLNAEWGRHRGEERLGIRAKDAGRQRIGRLQQGDSDGGLGLRLVQAEQLGGDHGAADEVNERPHLAVERAEEARGAEAARGRFAVRVVSDGTDTPYRVKLRTPSFSNLSLFEETSAGMILPDALALMGSLDLVIPDIDR